MNLATAIECRLIINKYDLRKIYIYMVKAFFHNYFKHDILDRDFLKKYDLKI